MHKLMDRYRGRRATEEGADMADSFPNPNSGDDADVGTGAGSPTGTPRWVKVFVIIALVLLLVLVIGLITGRAGPGGHGPGRHTGSADAVARTPPAVVAERQNSPAPQNAARNRHDHVTPPA
jgi:hypothetical protein